MSVTDAPLSKQGTRVSDQYDHAIRLIDTTGPAEAPEDGEDAYSQRSSKDPGWRDLAKRPTRNTLRENLVRRKYGKWQEGRESFEEPPPQAEGGEGSTVAAEVPESEPSAEPNPVKAPTTEETDFAARDSSQGRGRPQKKPEDKDTDKPRTKQHHKIHNEFSEVDILYENQRGWFICGIPLYSHSSLLNFDPSPWVTKEFKDSPVNITNAQVPDPTWKWDWTSWYVDMSYDVDEEGWQYSFSFSPKFSWHGTHPWFHSFVRRRRWLRKRVKRHHGHIGAEKPGTMGAAHMLTGDYFTIHPKRDRSRDTDAGTTALSSHLSTGMAQQGELPPEDINDIPNLMQALRLASIDREKIDAVKHFVDQGGEELTYLKDAIPQIMSFLIFQNSRKQLLHYLKTAAEEASRHRQEAHTETREPEGDEEQRKADNLISAIEVADQQIAGLEYWSDRQHVLRTEDDDDHPRPNTAHESTISKNSVRKSNPLADDEIKGIPDAAAIGVDPTQDVVGRNATAGSAEEDNKGKARADNGADDEKTEGEVEVDAIGTSKKEDDKQKTTASNEEQEEAPPDENKEDTPQDEEEKENTEEKESTPQPQLPKDAMLMQD